MLIPALIIGVLFIGGGMITWMESSTIYQEILAAVLNGVGFIIIAMLLCVERLLEELKKRP